MKRCIALLLLIILTSGCSYGFYDRAGDHPSAGIEVSTDDHSVEVDTHGRVRVRGRVE